MLQDGQFAVETPVRARFSTPVQTGPEATLPPVQWVRGLIPIGKETRAMHSPSGAKVQHGYSYTSIPHSVPPLACYGATCIFTFT